MRVKDELKGTRSNSTPWLCVFEHLGENCLKVVATPLRTTIVQYFIIVLYCTVLYCIVLYCIVLYCIVLYCIVLYCIVSYFIVSYRIVSYRIVLHCNSNIKNSHSLLFILDINQTLFTSFKSSVALKSVSFIILYFIRLEIQQHKRGLWTCWTRKCSEGQSPDKRKQWLNFNIRHTSDINQASSFRSLEVLKSASRGNSNWTATLRIRIHCRPIYLRYQTNLISLHLDLR